MAKDPAFLFYPGDWLGGVMGFNRHEKGAYIDLLMCQFNNGHMDSHMVLTILGEKDHADLWDKRLRAKFLVDEEGKFYNEKLEYEVNRRKNYTKSRIKNLTHMGSHMDGHMENGNGNNVLSATNKKKNGYSKDFKVQREESFIAGLEKRAKESNGD